MKTIINMRLLYIIFLFTTSVLTASPFSSVFELHKKTLSNLDVPNPPQLILLSGTYGMGKSFVAKKIEKHLRAIRLSSDEARIFLREKEVPLSLIDDYLDYCLKRIQKTSHNRTIIMDRSCDRSYDRYALFAKKHGYKIFLIRLYAPRSSVEERIRSRGTDLTWCFDHLNDSWKDYEHFGKKHKFDFVINNTENSDLAPLFLKLDNSGLHCQRQHKKNATSSFSE